MVAAPPPTSALPDMTFMYCIKTLYKLELHVQVDYNAASYPVPISILKGRMETGTMYVPGLYFLMDSHLSIIINTSCMFDHCVLESNFVQGDARINAVFLVHVQDWYTHGRHMHAVVMGEKLADSFRLI